MRLREEYDWVVLGDNPGALLSACLVAHLGFSVLVLPMGPGLALLTSPSGQLLDREPNYVLGLGRVDRVQGVVAECLARLGITAKELEAVQSGATAPQVLTPMSRVSFQWENDVFYHELEREFGPALGRRLEFIKLLGGSELLTLLYGRKMFDRLVSDKRQARNFSRGFYEEFLTTRRIKKKLERRLARDGELLRTKYLEAESVASLARGIARPDLVQTCTGFWYGVTGSTRADPALLELIQTIALSRTGASFCGGINAYRQLLARIGQRLGAHFPQGLECKRLFIENGRLRGVQPSQTGTMVRVERGVLGCSLSHVAPYISETGRSWLRRFKESPQPIGWRLTVGLTVHHEAIPPGMTQRTVWNEAGAPVMEIEIANPMDYGRAGADQRLIFMRTVLPFQDQSLQPSHLRLIAGRMFHQLTEIMPFVEYHVRDVYPDFRSGEEDFRQAYGFSSVQEMPDSLRVFGAEAEAEESGHGPGHGLGLHSGIEGLFLASAESFPSIGSFGPTIAALEATRDLARAKGLTGPLV